MPAATENMEAEPDIARLRMLSVMIDDFVGPLPENSHCHICLDPWHSSSTSPNEILCKCPVTITHRNCRCHSIVLGKTCITTWLLTHDTCPMCRSDLFETPPPHLRRPPPPLSEDSETESLLAENEAQVQFSLIAQAQLEASEQEESIIYSALVKGNGLYE